MITPAEPAQSTAHDSPPTQLLALFLEHGTWPNWGPEVIAPDDAAPDQNP